MVSEVVVLLFYRNVIETVPVPQKEGRTLTMKSEMDSKQHLSTELSASQYSSACENVL